MFYRPHLEHFNSIVSDMKIKCLRKLLEDKEEEMDAIRAVSYDCSICTWIDSLIWSFVLIDFP